MILVWKDLGNSRINVSFFDVLGDTLRFSHNLTTDRSLLCCFLRENKRAMIVHREEYCAQCATWTWITRNMRRYFPHKDGRIMCPYDCLSNLTRGSLQTFLADDVR